MLKRWVSGNGILMDLLDLLDSTHALLRNISNTKAYFGLQNGLRLRADKKVAAWSFSDKFRWHLNDPRGVDNLRQIYNLRVQTYVQTATTMRMSNLETVETIEKGVPSLQGLWTSVNSRKRLEWNCAAEQVIPSKHWVYKKLQRQKIRYLIPQLWISSFAFFPPYSMLGTYCILRLCSSIVNSHGP